MEHLSFLHHFIHKLIIHNPHNPLISQSVNNQPTNQSINQSIPSKFERSIPLPIRVWMRPIETKGRSDRGDESRSSGGHAEFFCKFSFDVDCNGEDEGERQGQIEEKGFDIMSLVVILLRFCHCIDLDCYFCCRDVSCRFEF
mmetsp:Transcript_23204/g.33939  ORF Transcript_23204/g.33939 Transcript_23204/m.33939 type:complete len:142 (-) Transcript_23204:77-502(-)